MFSVYAPVDSGVTVYKSHFYMLFQISVCGDLWALGSFTPHDALRMYTTPDLYPIWKTKKPVVVSRESPFKYRYLQFSGGVFQSYEFIDRPREFTPKNEHVYNILLFIQNQLILLIDTYVTKEKQLSIPLSPGDYTTDSNISTPKAKALKPTASNSSVKTTESQRLQNILNSNESELIKKEDVLIIATYRLPLIIDYENNQWKVKWDEEVYKLYLIL